MPTLKELLALGIAGTFPVESAEVFYTSEVRTKTKRNPEFPDDRSKRLPIYFKDDKGNQIPAEYRDIAINDGSLDENIFVEVNKSYEFDKNQMIKFEFKITQYKEKFYYKAIRIKKIGGDNSSAATASFTDKGVLLSFVEKEQVSNLFEKIWELLSDAQKTSFLTHPGFKIVNDEIME